ncbi:porin [Labrys sp. ZIDIC5]|uniref:porin n=1 Tax=Labrys sedimenti TaxID=3106036 RepID=UPI002ACAA60E|nr:porin [Labrys sp. ZIDIC5]MDZ5454057.1 porin [Labrys sp. ZIDIC5]
MSIKSALLGAAAGVAAIGAAQAADLPMTKGEAVEYVKVCSAFGPGFFYIPGSDTCLKIGGEIRADYRVFGGTGFNRNDDRSAFNTQARIWFDARTETDWGLLRSYFQINADSHKISNQGRGGSYNSNTFSIDKAFIQFGGLTAGYAHSFFGFYDNEYGDTIWAPYYAQANTVNLLAYTAQFGGGFSATLSVEDGRDHRYNNIGLNYVPALNAILGPNTLSLSNPFGGQQVPDVVAQLRFDQSWGSIAVQGAAHQTRSAESITASVNGTPLGTIDLAHKQKWGYAVGGTLLLKIPAIDGGHFIVEGQYADGALDYLGANNDSLGLGVPGDVFATRVQNGVITGFKNSKGWSVVAELGGNITPVLNANLVASYIDTKADGSLVNVVFPGANVKPSFKAYTIAGNLTYTITKGLTVGAEVAYTHNKYGDVLDVAQNTLVIRDKKENIWQAGVRLKRTF